MSWILREIRGKSQPRQKKGRCEVKKILFFIFVLIFLVMVVVPTEAQQQKKRDRWELELSYGQFWVVKHDLPSNLIFVREKNPDFQLALRLRIWRGWYVGILAGMKKETQNEYFTDEIYTNYWWLEDRFGNFLAKNYIERDISVFKTAPYIGAETKLNLLTIKFSKSIGLTPYGRAGIKRWFAQTEGFFHTKDYILYDLDKSTSTPYMIYNYTATPVGVGRYHGKVTIWLANPDGTKGPVVYEDEWQNYMSNMRAGGIFFYGGGMSLRIGKVGLNAEWIFERRKDNIFDGENKKFIGSRKFQHAMWRVGLGYRF
ncbi:MAG: hypothetical protein N2692_01330 [Patescibacteria group bacterium]|jgi:hypothetical protein|nr:hypothetical protein [Patescibacteria group bacterium]